MFQQSLSQLLYTSFSFSKVVAYLNGVKLDNKKDDYKKKIVSTKLKILFLHSSEAINYIELKKVSLCWL